jgi:hypothetical protein
MSANAQFQSISSTLITINPNTVLQIPTEPNYIGSLVQYIAGGSAFINGVSATSGHLLNTTSVNLTPFRGNFFLICGGSTATISLTKFFT